MRAGSAAYSGSAVKRQVYRENGKLCARSRANRAVAMNLE
jgi:hypothetical protein